MKILILKPSSLGDVVQALPVLRLLKKHLPESEIYWWIDTKLAPLLEDDPDLAGLIHFHRQRWAAPIYWGELWRSILQIRAHRFDWVIDLQCLFRSGTFAWLANGQLTVGLDEPREGARGFYDLVARRASFHTHAVDWYLSVLPLLKIPANRDYTWLPLRPAAAKAVREKWPVINSGRLAFQPGARWQNKRWPIEYFCELAVCLANADASRQLVVLGGDEDRSLGEAIARVIPNRCLDLTGKVTLAEMVEWVRLSDLLISNDTGPMHIAAALGTPVVALFGPTEPRRTGPYGQIESAIQIPLPCVPCMKDRCHNPNHLECLRTLSPTQVFEAIQKRLSNPVPSIR